MQRSNTSRNATSSRALGTLANASARPIAIAIGELVRYFTDISFAQHRGWALRASAKYRLSRRWSVEPSYIYWNVGSSPVNDQTVTFTVDNVTAREQWGAYEPQNATDEFSVKLGFHF